MAGVTMIPNPDNVQYNIVFDDDCDATVIKDVDRGPTDLLMAQVVNADASIRYLHFWDNRAPAIGVDAQDIQLPVPASGTLTALLMRGARFLNALSFACTSDKGTTANTDPTTPPDVRLATSGGILRALGAVITPTAGVGEGARTISPILGTREFITAEADQTVKAAGSSATVVYGIRLDNTMNTAPTFLKIYDLASPTVGTDDPDIVLRAPGGLETVLIVPAGINLATDCTFACVTTGGTGGVTGPASPVGVCLYLG